jgi:hypothetical protein
MNAIGLFALTLWPALALAQAQTGSPWKKLAQEDGMLIEARPMPGTRLREIRLTTASSLAPELIFNVIWNAKDQRDWVPNVKELRVLRSSDDEVVLYERIKIPVVQDRDYVLSLAKKIDKAAGIYQIFAVGKSELGPPPPSGVVRMTRLSSTYTIKALPEGGSQITYLSFGDPAGSVPAWLIRAADVKAPKDFVKAILKRAQKIADKR